MLQATAVNLIGFNSLFTQQREKRAELSFEATEGNQHTDMLFDSQVCCDWSQVPDARKTHLHFKECRIFV